MKNENEPMNLDLEERKVVQIFKKKMKNTFVSIRDLTRYITGNSKYRHLLVILSSYLKMKNLKELDYFLSFIKATEEINPEEITQQRTQSEMFQKKVQELLRIKQFVNDNYNQLLPQDFHYVNYHLKEINAKEEDIIVEPLNTMLGQKKQRDTKSPSSFIKEITKKGTLKQSCYICKAMFTKDRIHPLHLYLCKNCGDLNQSFKTLSLNLTGRIAVVTGGRVKIGYEIAKKLLEYNCKVIVTSRFPKDTLHKYRKESNYSKWKSNLIIYPIDFRFFQSTNIFIDYLYKSYDHIDILINNAAQTIRRTSAYYHYLLPIAYNEQLNEEENIVKCDYVNTALQIKDNGNKEDKEKEENNCTTLVQSSTVNDSNDFIPFSVFASQIKIMKEKDQPSKTIIGTYGQPYDLSSGKSSWNMEIDDVPFEEFMEVQLINVWTPYYLNIKLKELLMKSPSKDKYIVNVSSVEGMFNKHKTTKHPHTNMAKAALNMMTRTVGAYYKKKGIYMTSVDTGWVSEMNEANQMFDDKDNTFQSDFINIPLDEEDGAIRVLHPIIEGLLGKHYYSGILLKDFKIAQW